VGKAVYSTVQRGGPENFDESVSHTKTRRRLKAFTRDALAGVCKDYFERSWTVVEYMGWYDV